MTNAVNHFKMIIRHKYYVFKHCCKAHLYWRGLIHDLSKFSPTEFFESIKYYNDTHSPIDECKKKNGYSNAWLHHKGRNKHHYEYWQDNFDNGGTPLMMPYPYALELICDYLGARQAYTKKNKVDKQFYIDEFNWWENRLEKPLAFHSQTKDFVSSMFYIMSREGNNDCLRPVRSKAIYNACFREYKNDCKKNKESKSSL